MEVFVSNDKVFEPDELELLSVQPDWTRETLLSARGILFLKDCVHLLEIDSTRIKKRAHALTYRGEDPWRVMGVRKIWNHWILRMHVFAPYFRRHFTPRSQPIPNDWDANNLLEQHGIYELTAVCKLLPLTPQQVRYQARQSRNAKTELGVWRDDDARGYVVDMAVFSKWFRSIWRPDQSPKQN